MIQNVLRHLGGVENYGVLSLCLFVLIFTMMLVWTFRQGRPYLERMAKLPLESEKENPTILRKDDER